MADFSGIPVPRVTRSENARHLIPHILFFASASLCVILFPILSGCAAPSASSPSPTAALVTRQAAIEEEVRALREQVRSLSAMKEEYDRRLSDEVLKKPLEESLDRYGQRLDAMEGRIREVERKLGTLEGALDSARAAWEKKMETVLDVVKSENAELREAIAGMRKGSASMGWEHTVARGETLGAIAKEYGARLKDIIEANEIDNPHRIRVGQTLFIPRPAR